jgi:hypothetical protein
MFHSFKSGVVSLYIKIMFQQIAKECFRMFHSFKLCVVSLSRLKMFHSFKSGVVSPYIKTRDFLPSFFRYHTVLVP